jgi:poly(hydroxyalkanoate) granule-associated protein
MARKSQAKPQAAALFEKLVEQGKGLREKARGAADEAMKTVRSQAEATATQAQGQWDKLEQVFEERVSRSLHRLGVMTREELDDLSRQVQELNASVQALMKAQGVRAKPAAKKRATRKARKAKALTTPRVTRSTSFTYAFMASSVPIPLSFAHASYLARFTKSVKPGLSPATSPSVACL